MKRNPLSTYLGGGTLVDSDRRWANLARKGYDLLVRNGIHLSDGPNKIAVVEVDSAKPSTVIGALAYYPQSLRDGRLIVSFDLAVDERARGRGVGRQLIESALKIAASHAAFTSEKHFEIDVNTVNNIVMEALRRRGFTISYLGGLGEWHARKVIR